MEREIRTNDAQYLTPVEGAPCASLKSGLSFLANLSCVNRYLLESMLRGKRHQNRFCTAKTLSGPLPLLQRYDHRNLARQPLHPHARGALLRKHP